MAETVDVFFTNGKNNPRRLGRFSAGTQEDKIENLLRSKYGVWFPCYELADLALQYCRAVSSIRKRLKRAGDVEIVENKVERVNGQAHGSYRIIRKIDALLSSEPAKPPAAKSWAEICAERDRKLASRESTPDLVLTCL